MFFLDEKRLAAQKSNDEIRATIDARIIQRKKQIERLEKKREKYGYVSWYDTVVTPLMYALEEETGLQGEIYGPFGLRAETTIYLRKDMSKSICDQETWSIELTTNGDDVTCYATGRQLEHYPEGSIGWLNGFGKEELPLPDTIEEIVKLLRHSKGSEKASA